MADPTVILVEDNNDIFFEDADSTPIAKPVEKTDADATAIQLDPMDVPAAVLYYVFNAILSITPVTVWYTVAKPQLAAAVNDNRMLEFAWYFVWVGNLVLYAIPTVIGGFAWLWNAYVTAGYVAWTQYLIVWGGSIMQILNFGLMLAGAATYDDTGSVSAADRSLTAWAEFSIWAFVTSGCYIGYWLLNNNFLAYWVIEEIIHGISASGDNSYEQLKIY